jgi:hypothetical protein
MPAAGVLVEIYTHRYLAFRLETGDVGGDELAPRRADFVGKCEQRRQDGRRRVTAHRVVAVVEIQCMRGGTVDQRCVEWCGAFVGTEQ